MTNDSGRTKKRQKRDRPSKGEVYHHTLKQLFESQRNGALTVASNAHDVEEVCIHCEKSDDNNDFLTCSKCQHTVCKLCSIAYNQPVCLDCV